MGSEKGTEKEAQIKQNSKRYKVDMEKLGGYTDRASTDLLEITKWSITVNPPHYVAFQHRCLASRHVLALMHCAWPHSFCVRR